ncbi:MAG: amidohydrolase family protein [Acidimicrobiia bacterium]|nr:amidohydrolase family protein [Acidimicrobiia bacterium]
MLISGACVGAVAVGSVLLPGVAQVELEAQAGLVPATARRAGEGVGPFNRLVIRNVMVIDGTGGPPFGPMNVVVSGNRIQAIQGAGTPGLRPTPAPAGRAGAAGGRGGAQAADHEIDGTGMYLMPGFVDLHVHAGGAPKNAEAEYAYKLWLAHGVTTVRGVALGSNQFSVSERARSEKNEIAAPRIFNCQRPGGGNTPEGVRDWVRQNANTLDCLKLGAMEPDVMAAVIDEAHKHGLGTTAHLQQGGVAQMNAIDAARVGLDTVTHFYGHFESLLKDTVVQDWPVDMNANDEQHRFGQVARMWNKIYEPGSPEWKAYLQEHLKLGTTFDPTMTIYSAGRDVMRAREADYHEKYTLPSLMDFYTPSRRAHGSYWFDWTTHDEIAWKNFYQVWFKLVNDYKKMGGRVGTGSDSGFIYQTYGFGYILELEMLQEAGFHPLEVFQAATMNGAATLSEWRKQPVEFGVVKAGKLADMVLVDQNPLHNLKVLYGNGAVKLNDETEQVERVGGVRWTIKDGIVYDAKKLLADVAVIVEKQKAERKK